MVECAGVALGSGQSLRDVASCPGRFAGWFATRFAEGASGPTRVDRLAAKIADGDGRRCSSPGTARRVGMVGTFVRTAAWLIANVTDPSARGRGVARIVEATAASRAKPVRASLFLQCSRERQCVLALPLVRVRRRRPASPEERPTRTMRRVL